MELRKIVAVIRRLELEKVEDQLRKSGVTGISVSPVKGSGEYANLYKPDLMVTNAKIEIFAEQSRVDEIVTTILETAHSGVAGDGIVAVLPVEKLYRIRTKAEIDTHEL